MPCLPWLMPGGVAWHDLLLHDSMMEQVLELLRRVPRFSQPRTDARMVQMHIVMSLCASEHASTDLPLDDARSQADWQLTYIDCDSAVWRQSPEASGRVLEAPGEARLLVRSGSTHAAPSNNVHLSFC